MGVSSDCLTQNGQVCCKACNCITPHSCPRRPCCTSCLRQWRASLLSLRYSRGLYARFARGRSLPGSKPAKARGAARLPGSWTASSTSTLTRCDDAGSSHVNLSVLTEPFFETCRRTHISPGRVAAGGGHGRLAEGERGNYSK